jgi:hypothetical protein
MNRRGASWDVRAKALSDAAWNAINEANSGVPFVDNTTPIGKMSELLLEMATHLGAAGRLIDELEAQIAEGYAQPSTETSAYRDQITKLNKDAMGDSDEWDSHGQQVFDLVMSMAAHIDELNAEKRSSSFLDEALNSGDGTYKP